MPYHDWAMAVLRRIPCDGTFNQTAPLKYVRFGNDVSSFDLKSATDRFPSQILFHVMEALFGEEKPHSGRWVKAFSYIRYLPKRRVGKLCPLTDRAAIRLEQKRSRSLNWLTWDDKSIMSEFYDSGSERSFKTIKKWCFFPVLQLGSSFRISEWMAFKPGKESEVSIQLWY